MSTLTKTIPAALFAALAATGAARAQDYYDEEPIRQTVARLAYVSGEVSFARGDDPDDWQPADPNIPMTIGDRSWTAGGRLELQVHGGNLIRLAPGTDLAALNLTEDTKQFSLSAGAGSFRIRRLGDDEVFEVDTPNAAITFERPGDYRVDVRPDGDTRVQVRHGRAIVASGGGQVPLSAGDAILIEGYDPPRYDFIALAAPDGWDGWVEQRDARYANVRSYQYVSADIAGVEDLDRYGRWRRIPNYGWAWYPRSVGSGWIPYRAGRWIWQDPWGWTWVSSEPWGWAPYHYGRWVVWGGRWYWVPVAPTVPVVAYSPALVVFVGGGPGFSYSAGFSTDYIGWFPLAPRDPLIPWWGRPTVNVNVNVTNITYVNRTYVTVVNQTTFIGGRPIASNYVRDKSIVNRIERAPVVRGPIPVVPTRDSIRTGVTRETRAVRPPAAIGTRPVVTRSAPAPAPPRFDAKVAVIRENRGAPVNSREAARIVEREDRAAPRPVRETRPAASESGRVTLQPKSDNQRGAKPEPVAPGRGRPTATSERPVAPPSPIVPTRESSRARPEPAQPTERPQERRPAARPVERPTAPPAERAPESRPAARPAPAQPAEAAPSRQAPPQRAQTPTPTSRERQAERAAPAPRPAGEQHSAARPTPVQAPAARQAPERGRERKPSPSPTPTPKSKKP